AVLAERLGVPSIEREIAELRKRELSETSRPYDGDIHSEVYSLARACFAPLKAMTDAHAVTAHTVLQNIIKNIAQIVQMTGVSPKNEAEVRNAVLNVCRFAFPDAIKEVGIVNCDFSLGRDRTLSQSGTRHSGKTLGTWPAPAK